MTVDVVDAGRARVCRSAVVATVPHELFDIVARPREHHELDGSGTVGATISGPERMSQGAKFTTHMKQFGVSYRITSVVTGFDEDRLIEWMHPLGHRWRWEFSPAEVGSTLVTETFDFSTVGRMRSGYFRLINQPAKNARGIESTLRNLQNRYAA